jgi:hypothetical protein
MGTWRFQKRIQLCKGIRVNLGQTGASLSFGGPGARVTVGSRGQTMTVGIPGSGLSYQERFPRGGRCRGAGDQVPAWQFHGLTAGEWLCLGWFLAVALLIGAGR